jgi:peptidoglycan/xylan/chitin deacetylase (PgdA/CDA1 family)
MIQSGGCRARRWFRIGLTMSTFFLLLMAMIPHSYGTEGILCNCVAFRLDDIQDYWLNSVQTEIIETFSRNNASLTVGIIANYFGEDEKVVSFLKARLSDNQTEVGYAPLEIANHGWNHEDFTAFSKTEQSELMAKANQKIFDSIGVRPSVFIAPLNRMNNDTIQAALENDIHYVSADLTAYPILIKNSLRAPSEEMTNSIISHFPSTVVTGDLNSDDTEWYGVPHNETLEDIDVSIQKYGYAIVTLHPQEYAMRDGLDFQNIIDDVQMYELELVLKDLHKREIRVVTISQISGYSVMPEFTDMLLYLPLLLPIAVIIIYTRIGRLLLSGRNR